MLVLLVASALVVGEESESVDVGVVSRRRIGSGRKAVGVAGKDARL